MVIDIIPAKDIGTFISVCNTGHAEPNRESGKPRLIKQTYMSINHKLAIVIQFLMIFYY